VRIKIAAIALLMAGNASAYSFLGMDWAGQPDLLQSWELNAASFPQATGTELEIEAAWTAGAATWNDLGSPSFAWNYAGLTLALSLTYDDRMVAQWLESTPGLSTVATTVIWSIGPDILECDVEFYGANGLGDVHWSADPAGADPDEIDLQKAATHELGHCLGLDHSTERDAVMYSAVTAGGQPADRVLHLDDIGGFDALYGSSPVPDLALVSVSLAEVRDGNGAFEAGELIAISVVIDNISAARATNAIATLASSSTDLRVITATATPDHADHPGLTTRTYFEAELQVEDACTLDGDAQFSITLSADNLSAADPIITDIALSCGPHTAVGAEPHPDDLKAPDRTSDTGVLATFVIEQEAGAAGCSSTGGPTGGWLVWIGLLCAFRMHSE
jgi:hypothetical protein